MDPIIYRTERDEAAEEFLRMVFSGPAILDPTLTIEPDRLGLQRTVSELFLPKTWVTIVESEDWKAAGNVVRSLRWNLFFQRGPEIGYDQQLALKEWVGSINRSYASTASDRDRLVALSPTGWKLKHPVDAILADIYSFLRETGRSVVAKSRRPFFALRDRGISILEFGGDVLHRKRRFFRGHPNWKFYVGALIPLQMLLNESSPQMRLLGVLAQETLAFTDPEP